MEQGMVNMEILLHSITDLITNSSTTIYTYSERSLEPCKEMINVMLKMFGSDKTCDDIFELSVELDTPNDLYYSVAWRCDEKQLPTELRTLVKDVKDRFAKKDVSSFEDFREKLKTTVDNIIDQYKKGLIEKPYFLREIEDIGFYDSPRQETTLRITPKDPKYQELAEKFVKFLYSTDHESHYDG
jgi:hypothetical protein